MEENPIYFWEKPMPSIDSFGDDTLSPTSMIPNNPDTIRLIRLLEKKILGKKILLSETRPKNASVPKWINKIFNSYPNIDDNVLETIDDLLNTWRSSLYNRSKEREKFIVALLLTNDTMILAHSKKIFSLAEVENKVQVVNRILDPQNIYRASIIKREDNQYYLGAYERSRKLSKGLAEFWGISPKEIGYDVLGSISFIIKMDSFSALIRLDLELEEFEQMVKTGTISKTGIIKLGREKGKIEKVKIGHKEFEFGEFYEIYILEKEKLDKYKRKFNEIIEREPKGYTSLSQWGVLKAFKFRYIEDEEGLYELTANGRQLLLNKEHPRFYILFATQSFPGIGISHSLLWKIYDSIFNNLVLEVWHAGEAWSNEPTIIGNLHVYNDLHIPEELLEFSENMLDIIKDADSVKTKLLLEKAFCDIWLLNLVNNKHFKSIFNFIQRDIILDQINYEFESNSGLLEKEGYIEFKSVDKMGGKPTDFAEEIARRVVSYTRSGRIVYMILYGIEDDGTLRPAYHAKSELLEKAENIVNTKLREQKVNSRVKIFRIPYKEGHIIGVSIIPFWI